MMSIMNSFVDDLFERIAAKKRKESHATKGDKKRKGKMKESYAIYIYKKVELAKHAVSEETKAVTKYTSS